MRLAVTHTAGVCVSVAGSGSKISANSILVWEKLDSQPDCVLFGLGHCMEESGCDYIRAGVGRRAYYVMAKRMHPDKCQGADALGAKERFQRICEAYQARDFIKLLPHALPSCLPVARACKFCAGSQVFGTCASAQGGRVGSTCRHLLFI